MRVTEGIYDPRQGDFAVAGSVDLELGVPERGLQSQTSSGSFGTLRQLVLWAPEGEAVESFGAATYGRTDGFGEHRDGQHAGVIAQHVMESGRWKGRVLGSFYGARSRLAGVLRQDDIDRGAVDFYDVYPDPVAQNQSAFASEGKLGLFAEHHGRAGSESRFGAWLGLHAFRIQQAFTGYTERSQINPEWAGRGDLIEQQNARPRGFTAAKTRATSSHVVRAVRKRATGASLVSIKRRACCRRRRTRPVSLWTRRSLARSGASSTSSGRPERVTLRLGAAATRSLQRRRALGVDDPTSGATATSWL